MRGMPRLRAGKQWSQLGCPNRAWGGARKPLFSLGEDGKQLFSQLRPLSRGCPTWSPSQGDPRVGASSGPAGGGQGWGVGQQALLPGIPGPVRWNTTGPGAGPSSRDPWTLTSPLGLVTPPSLLLGSVHRPALHPQAAHALEDQPQPLPCLPPLPVRPKLLTFLTHTHSVPSVWTIPAPSSVPVGNCLSPSAHSPHNPLL